MTPTEKRLLKDTGKCASQGARLLTEEHWHFRVKQGKDVLGRNLSTVATEGGETLERSAIP